MSSSIATRESTYVLGHSDEELNRLMTQARFYNALSSSFLLAAGLSEGMRVLDVGCGAGDMAFLAAGMVGPEGTVIGVDVSPDAIALAEWRAAEAGLTNVRFLHQDATEVALDVPCDAVIGRLVLMYFSDPALALRRVLTNVRSGGLVAFQEIDIDGAASHPRCQIFETAIERIRQAFTRAGINVRTGLALGRIFEEAGLPTPTMMLGACVERGPDAALSDQVAGITRTLLPLMEQAGVASADEVSIESLSERIRAEAVSLGATLVSPSLIGAWATTDR